MTERTPSQAVQALNHLIYQDGVDRAVATRLRTTRHAAAGSPEQPTPEEQAVELGIEVVRLRGLLEDGGAQLAELRASHTRVCDRRDELARQNRAAVDEITGIRRQVRDRLIESMTIGDLTSDALDSILADLDLEPFTRDYTVEVTVYGFQRVKVCVEAGNADEARERVHGAGWIAWEHVAGQDWQPLERSKTHDSDITVHSAILTAELDQQRKENP